MELKIRNESHLTTIHSLALGHSRRKTDGKNKGPLHTLRKPSERQKQTASKIKKKNDVMGIYRKRRTETRESNNNRSHSKEVNTKRGYRDDDRCQQVKKSKEPCICTAKNSREEVKMKMLVFADFLRRNTEKSLSFGVEGGG